MIRWRPILAGLAMVVTGGVATIVILRTPPRSEPAADPASWGVTAPTPVSIEDLPPTPPTPQTQTQAREQQRQRQEAALTAALRRYHESRYVDLALTVVDRNTGRTFSYNGQRSFETASIVKVDLLASLLLQSQRSRRPLTAAEKSLATAMIKNSDNAAASDLWSRTGGISRSTEVFGLTATTPGADGHWGATTTTAEDQARLITALADPDGPVEDAGYLFGLMRNVKDSQGWGISAAARPDETVALKNGWMTRAGADGRWTVNSIGRVTGPDTDVTVVVLSRGHASLAGGIGMVETVAKMTRDHLGW